MNVRDQVNRNFSVDQRRISDVEPGFLSLPSVAVEIKHGNLARGYFLCQAGSRLINSASSISRRTYFSFLHRSFTVRWAYEGIHLGKADTLYSKVLEYEHSLKAHFFAFLPVYNIILLLLRLSITYRL